MIMAQLMENMINEKGEYASNTKGNAALTLGIIGTALGAMSAGNGIFSNIFNKTQGNNGQCMVTLSNEELYLERKQMSDQLYNVQSNYETKIQNLKDLSDAFFASYQRDVDNSMRLYQYSRDNKDELMNMINNVEKKVDTMAAIRPYQDALINAKIDNNALIADYNLARRTCKMIEGQVVLPSTPTVTGYGSYFSCCNLPTPTVTPTPSV